MLTLEISLVHTLQQIRLLKACVRYFSLFLKNNVLFDYFEQNTLKRSLTYSCFIFPLFHEHLFSHELPRAARLLKTSCFEKITVCVIETMLVTLPLVQMNKAWMEVSRQIKHATVLRMYLNDWKNILRLFQLQFFVNQVVNLHIVILWILASCNSL